MFKRMLGVGVLAAGVVAGLSACDVNQISWANHFYVVSSTCAQPPMTPGAVTLHDGVGYIGTPGTSTGTRVDLLNVHEGDFTHDGVQDAAVLLNCHDTVGGNNNGSEIQVFTRDAKPVERLVAPQKYPGGSFPPYFVYNEISVVGNTLYTGVDSFLPGDSHAGPSAHDVYRWDWNGHGFTPVDITTTIGFRSTDGSLAKLNLPAGWVAEAVASTPQSHPIVPTWCLMPHSAPAPADADAPGCTIAFEVIPIGAAQPKMSGDTPGGLATNPEFCPAPQSQTVTLQGYLDRKFGARNSTYRNWHYACQDGSSWQVEQYAAMDVPSYVLYSSHATPAVHTVLTSIAKTAQLPPISGPLPLWDLGILRNAVATTGGYHVWIERVLRTPTGTVSANQFYETGVPTAAIPRGFTFRIGDLIELNTNGVGVTSIAKTT